MEFILQNYIWIALALLSGGLLFAPLIRGGSAFGVSPSDVVTLINRKDAVIVDVRDQKEFETAHLANARHIPAAELADRSGELAKFKNRPIVVVCQSGTRAGSAAAKLRKAGFEQAVTLDGGIKAWQDAGLPVAAKA
ncbi:rhodanese-like domain-containing protein [Uliginosibacterium sp. sgz301328]|uniref:rhodanese-like domain-containing protein n=1 Tax=Uliginosibacterium sp. sgz301328 TaxID=3243764 RepID=UPI00359E98DA